MVELTPEFALKYTRLATGIFFAWPLNRKASRFQVILYNAGWFICWAGCIFVSFFLLATAYKHRGDFMSLTKFVCHAVCIFQVIIKMFIGKQHYGRYQYLFDELDTFLKNATPHEREVLTNYVKRVAPSHFKFNMVSLFGSLAVLAGPLTSDQPLPTEAEYPFPVDKNPVYAIIFCLQSIGIIECGCTGPFDCQGCLLIWFATVRFEFLAEKMRSVRTPEELNEYIRLHQHLLWYVDEIITAVRPVVAATVVLATLCVAFGGIHIIANEPFEEKVQFFAINIGYSLELLIMAWAAENLIAASEQVGWALYSSPWVQNSNEMNKIALFVMQRSIRTPNIEIGGLLPQLCMSYYATYMSKTFSFFTTLRIMLTQFENDDLKVDT